MLAETLVTLKRVKRVKSKDVLFAAISIIIITIFGGGVGDL